MHAVHILVAEMLAGKYQGRTEAAAAPVADNYRGLE